MEEKKPINCFPGYEFKWVDGYDRKQNMYRGTNMGFGGYVYCQEGIYTNVALLDVASLHPHSILALNKFGKYTPIYKEILMLVSQLNTTTLSRLRKCLMENSLHI